VLLYCWLDDRKDIHHARMSVLVDPKGSCVGTSVGRNRGTSSFPGSLEKWLSKQVYVDADDVIGLPLVGCMAQWSSVFGRRTFPVMRSTCS